MSADLSPFMRLVPFLHRTFLPEQKQMDRVIQSDQMPETPRTKGEKGHMEQEAPQRPQSRTKCVDEVMYLDLQGQRGTKEKYVFQKEADRHLCVRFLNHVYTLNTALLLLQHA